MTGDSNVSSFPMSPIVANLFQLFMYFEEFSGNLGKNFYGLRAVLNNSYYIARINFISEFLPIIPPLPTRAASFL